MHTDSLSLDVTPSNTPFVPSISPGELSKSPNNHNNKYQNESQQVEQRSIANKYDFTCDGDISSTSSHVKLVYPPKVYIHTKNKNETNTTTNRNKNKKKKVKIKTNARSSRFGYTINVKTQSNDFPPSYYNHKHKSRLLERLKSISKRDPTPLSKLWNHVEHLDDRLHNLYQRAEKSNQNISAIFATIDVNAKDPKNDSKSKNKIKKSETKSTAQNSKTTNSGTTSKPVNKAFDVFDALADENIDKHNLIAAQKIEQLKAKANKLFKNADSEIDEFIDKYLASLEKSVSSPRVMRKLSLTAEMESKTTAMRNSLRSSNIKRYIHNQMANRQAQLNRNKPKTPKRLRSIKIKGKSDFEKNANLKTTIQPRKVILANSAYENLDTVSNLVLSWSKKRLRDVDIAQTKLDAVHGIQVIGQQMKNVFKNPISIQERRKLIVAFFQALQVNHPVSFNKDDLSREQILEVLNVITTHPVMDVNKEITTRPLAITRSHLLKLQDPDNDDQHTCTCCDTCTCYETGTETKSRGYDSNDSKPHTGFLSSEVELVFDEFDENWPTSTPIPFPTKSEQVCQSCIYLCMCMCMCMCIYMILFGSVFVCCI